MKNLLLCMLMLSSSVLLSCKTTSSMALIEPKEGSIDLPAKGEIRIWKDIAHPRFSVILTNPSSTQSCELYTVTESGSQKWIDPSLQAGKSITVKVPKNGHLFVQNNNPNVLKIMYKVE